MCLSGRVLWYARSEQGNGPQCLGCGGGECFVYVTRAIEFAG